jgi:hypothetical protein
MADTHGPPMDGCIVRVCRQPIGRQATGDKRILVTREEIEGLLGQFNPLLVDDGLWLDLVAISNGTVNIRLTGLSGRCAAGASLNFQASLEQAGEPLQT